MPKRWPAPPFQPRCQRVQCPVRLGRRRSGSLLPWPSRRCWPFRPLSRGVSLAEWATLLGAVREPDFQAWYQSGLRLRLAPRLPASPSPTSPTRIAPICFPVHQPTTPRAATGASCGWPNQARRAWLSRNRGAPAGRRLPGCGLPKSDLGRPPTAAPPPRAWSAVLLPGPNPAAQPVLDWPADPLARPCGADPLELPDRRVSQAAAASPAQQARQVAVADVVLQPIPCSANWPC